MIGILMMCQGKANYIIIVVFIVKALEELSTLDGCRPLGEACCFLEL